MPAIGAGEILVVALFALIVFGPDKLPGMIRTVGRFAGEMRRMASEVRSEFEEGFEVGDDQDPPELLAPDPADAAGDATKPADDGPGPAEEGPGPA